MNLKHEKSAIFEVDSDDLDEFISGVYKQKFEFIVDHVANNDSCYSFDIEPASLEWDQNKLNKFIITGRYGFLTRIILIDLCNAGLIESGKYIIKVSW